MEKIRIDCLIFGYRMVKVSECDVDKTLSILFKNGVISSVSPEGCFIIRERDLFKVECILRENVNFEVSSPRGFYGRIFGIKHKLAVTVSLCIVIFLCILSSNTVWDVRIEGNETISDAEIILELEKCGLAVGDMWPSVDRSLVENSVLSNYESISWININRRGSVAYVNVIEKQIIDNSPTLPKYSNVVANEDCIIEEITVKSGVAAVRVGDVVKKGDLLISGVLPLESGGGFCNAGGYIKGRISDRVEVTIPRNADTKNLKSERVGKLTLNFFDFSINIFKIYGNLDSECDIIEEKEAFSLFGEKKLPFSITIEYIREYETSYKVFADDEIVALASKKLASCLFTRLVGADLVKIKSSGKFTESGYKIYSDIIFCAEVGCTLEYQIE